MISMEQKMEIETKFTLDDIKKFIESMGNGMAFHHDRGIGANGKVIRFNPTLEIGDWFTLEDKLYQIIDNDNLSFTCVDIYVNKLVKVKHKREMVKQGI